jgi:Na+-transporting methylmalonyl-CoA/oxaloacetate decarboxylase gamma subunit
MTNFIITLFVVIALLVVLLLYISNMAKNDRKELKLVREELTAEKERVGYLMRHLEEITEIKKDEKTISQKIEKAETDEEVCDILSAIINANNGRVQNNKTGK